MFANKLFTFKCVTPSITVSRNVGKCKFNWFNEGIQYPGFKYYPRNPNFQDPPYEPSKLFRVKRIRPLKGLPHWEKKILTEFKLDGNDYAIIKNIPENNQRLWKVKHAVQIVPITFPDGFPKETDRTVLTEYGELKIIKSIDSVEKRLQLADEFQKLPERMDGDTLRRNLRKKWLTGFENIA
ncbi:39S ribosomal protein L30, mitochondrial [Anthonomus grandis grandis]|uniref:39S ribosomal protein L30, mitochondrial n=1 Tax=Anthonomus grandis grandis TaxID=2921223 RepID=UPI00216636B3|nr:39S ribosomal protein L30, mitochondrial [Anthonomus grandis grandis]